MPDDCQNTLFVPISDVFCTDTDKLDLELIAFFDTQVKVCAGGESILGLHVNLLPVDNSWADLINDLEEDNAIADFFVEIGNKAILNTKRVDPESEGTLLLASLNVVIKHGRGLVLFLGQLLKSVLCVKDFSNEDDVDFGVAFDNISETNDIRDTDLSGLNEHLLGSHQIISFFEGFS